MTFDNVKKKLCNLQILQYLYIDQPFILTRDTLNNALAAEHLQKIDSYDLAHIDSDADISTKEELTEIP